MKKITVFAFILLAFAQVSVANSIDNQCKIAKGISSEGESLLSELLAPFDNVQTADPKQLSDRKVKLFNPKYTKFKQKYPIKTPIPFDQELLEEANNVKVGIGVIANYFVRIAKAPTKKEKERLLNELKGSWLKSFSNLNEMIKEQCK
ncbi:hypothetical protein EV694_1232 [Volucribacter psittacicida]|uniref:Uncharacterized protein n=1 Tax=Volucribacter psittacicida TaxID=203482 RepID=A0A4V2PBV4_9PAST|nr:hypothetical protein [Volucribacter psittacicida]TCJ98805.1 hypothetical protein EV694_1232 [Volucribacter psittacicida]